MKYTSNAIKSNPRKIATPIKIPCSYFSIHVLAAGSAFSSTSAMSSSAIFTRWPRTAICAYSRHMVCRWKQCDIILLCINTNEVYVCGLHHCDVVHFVGKLFVAHGHEEYISKLKLIEVGKKLCACHAGSVRRSRHVCLRRLPAATCLPCDPLPFPLLHRSCRGI